MTQARPHGLDVLLRPSSIAVIGASRDSTKRGHRALQALRDAGYGGRVIPVHPAGGELLGWPVARGPGDLAAPPDLALICTPAPTVSTVLEEWAVAGTRGAVVLASGFAESGEAGAQLERDMRDVIARTGIRVIGPNTSGILNVSLGLNLIGVAGVAEGPISLVVQSGNLALALMTEAAATGPGFSLVVGVGNEADVGFHELLDFLETDERTRVVVVHAEGFRNGAAFLAAARRLAATKPVVMLKAGRTLHGDASARSHTGAIAGSYAALHAGLRQAGVIEVLRSDELLPVAAALAAQPGVAAGRGIAVLSDGGGHATIAVDYLHERGVYPATLRESTASGLRALLGRAAAVGNPIDLAGAADRDPLVFARTLELLAADEGVGAILLVGLFGGYAIRFSPALLDAEIDVAHRLVASARQAGVALVVHSLYADRRSLPLRILREAGVPVHGSLEVACRSVHALLERGALVHRLLHTPPPSPPALPDIAAADPFRQARDEGRTALLETEARELAEAFGVPLVPAVFCTTPAEAGTAAARIGGPVAVRIVAPAVPHKSESGGVALDTPVAHVESAARRVLESVGAWCREQDVEPDMRGVLVSPMLAAPIAELLVGIVRDPQFGPVLTIGGGGTDVELQRDTATRILPVDEAEIDEMLRSLRVAPVLAGYRGRAAADRGAIRRVVLALARCALACPALAEVEANPVFVYPDRAVAVDLRMFIRRLDE
ncbi:MAG TPA: acetate--CoA ligase family protein [Longimicrobiales bacterium]